MTADNRERRATECAARHEAAVKRLDQCADMLRAEIARNNAKLAGSVTVADIIDRHQAQARELPPRVERALDWAAAIGVGVMIGWLAAMGF